MWNRLETKCWKTQESVRGISLEERQGDGTCRIVRTVFTQYHGHEEVVATYRTYDEAKEAYDKILKERAARERARRKAQAQG